MGLDMYLEATTENRGILTNWTEVHYWRKANAIHGYFDALYAKGHQGHSLEDCEPMLITREQLTKMVKRLKKAVNRFYYDGDDSYARKWFSPTDGFFFGSTGMDFWYWKNLEDTAEKFQELLNTGEEDDEYDPQYVYFKYHAWW